MPLYTLNCLDKPSSLELRMATREAHLAHLRGPAPGLSVKLAGPILDREGKIIGSLIILEAPDRAAADAFAAADPYARAGLFQAVEIREFRATIGTL